MPSTPRSALRTAARALDESSASHAESGLCCADWRRSSAGGLLLSPNRTELRPADATDTLTEARATGDVSLLCGEGGVLSRRQFCEGCIKLGSRSEVSHGILGCGGGRSPSSGYNISNPRVRRPIGNESAAGRLNTKYLEEAVTAMIRRNSFYGDEL